MLQLKKRSDSLRGVRFMATICFYQDSRHEAPLSWIRMQIGCGYVSKRKDGMTELRVNGFSQVRETLETLLPFLRFKKIQANALLQACKLLEGRTITALNARTLRTVVALIMKIQQENYMSKGRRTKEEMFELLGLTP